MVVSKEQELAIRFSQLNPTDKDQERALCLMQKELDWDYLLRFCQEEGITGLIWHNFNKLKSLKPRLKNNIIPLKKTYQNTLAANLKLLQSFEYIMKHFEEEEITIILLQGAALLEMIYQDIGVRTLGDIDILVQEQDMNKLGNLLRKIGFMNIKHYPSLFMGQDILLDVHTDIANLSRISSRRYAITIPQETLWQASRAIKPASPLVRLLSIEDMLLALCAHLQKHSYNRLIWFVDISEVLRIYKADIDWEKLIQRARRFNLIKPLYFSLRFIAHYWNLPHILSLISHMHQISLNFIEQIALKKILKLEKIDRWGDILYLFNIKRKRDKLLFMLETLFPRPKIMAQIFNISSPFYLLLAYPLRLWQLILFSVKSFYSWILKKLKVS